MTDKQLQHMMLLAVLLAGLVWIGRSGEISQGSYLGVSTSR